MYDVLPEIKLVGKLSRAQKVKAYRQMERIRTKYERVVRAQFRGIFSNQMYSLLVLDDPTDRDIFQTVESYAPQMKHVLEWTYTNIAEDIYPMVNANMDGKAYRQRMETKAPADPISEDDVFAILIRQWIRKESANKIKGINDTTLAEIRDIFEASESTIAFRESLQSLYSHEIVPVRASMIARTETAAASNRASLETIKSLDSARTEMKTWNTALDAAVRDTHKHLESRSLEVAEPYAWTGASGYSKMDCPADGSHGAPAGEIINCRCFLTYYAEN